MLTNTLNSLIILSALLFTTTLCAPNNIDSDSSSPVTEIISLIRENNDQKASEVFNGLSYNESLSKIPDIVTTLYTENEDNVNSILSFLRKVRWCSVIAEGQTSLFNAMKSKGNERKPEILLLTGIDRRSENCDTYFTQTRANLKESVTDILGQWAPQIRSGDHDTVKDFLLKYKDSGTWSVLDTSLPELITVTYAGSVVNTENLLKFIKSLPFQSHIAVGLTALYDEMEKNGDDKSYPDVFKVGHELKTTMSSKQSAIGKLMEEFTRLKNKLPVVIQKIIWGDVCTIKNVLYAEYLYQAGNDFKRPSGEGRVFTWIPRDWNPRVPELTEGSWKFQTTEYGAQFQITNVFWPIQNNEFVNLVMDTGEKFDKKRHNITTSKLPSGYKSDNWILEPVNEDQNRNDSKGIFYLRSGWGKYFLYAGNDAVKYDNDRRGVFVSVGTRAVPSAAQWEIDCS